MSDIHESLLSLYKNSVSQEAGFNRKVMEWMLLEAKAQELSPEGYEGGLILDEMAIQPDLVAKRDGSYHQLVGFVDMGREATAVSSLLTGKCGKAEVADHVLQFVFLGSTGFRFPFAHFPCCQSTATDRHILFWKAVDLLTAKGFKVIYTIVDGTIRNRQFVHMHFSSKEAAVTSNYTMKSLVNPTESIHLLMDMMHNLKKIRNNILASDTGGMRRLVIDDCEVVWSMWRDSYQWDKGNPLQIHRKLTSSHVNLDSASKMRNQLSQDVLDADMLQLFLNFKQSLGEKGKRLDGCIQLLKHTAPLVDIFNDMRPINTVSDARLTKLQEVKTFFQGWETSVMENSRLTDAQKRRSLLSSKTREDIICGISAFIALCTDRFKHHPGYSIIPGLINIDVLKNIFCQQRGLHNGANSNPTYFTYQQTMPSIILGQASMSTKGNARKQDSQDQLTLSVPEPLSDMLDQAAKP